MRRIATWRVVGLVMAVLGIGVAVWLGCASWVYNANFHAWIAARPLETQIDFSTPGTTTATFRQTCSVAHGEVLLIDLGGARLSEVEVELQLAPLEGRLTIYHADGSAVVDQPLSPQPISGASQPVALLAMFSPFPIGEYRAEIQIDKPASAFAIDRPTIFAGYQICGLEQLPVFFLAAAAIASAVIGLIATACTAPGLLRHGIWQVW